MVAPLLDHSHNAIRHMQSMTARPFPPDDEQALRRAVLERPDAAHAHAALASFLCGAGRADEALAHLDHERVRRPASIWPLSIKAGILSAERRAAEAIDVHNLLVAMAPDAPLLWSNLGGDLAAVGDTVRAAAAYRRAAALAPGFGAAWLGLANLRIAPLSTEDIAAMEQALRNPGDPYQKVQMLFALGRSYGDLGAFDRSFKNFSEANSLREKLVPFDPGRLAALVDAQLTLPASFFSEQPDPQADGADAIFIVGMPRSGSTLVEQILDSHPDIEGMGELFALQDIASSLGAFEAPAIFIRRLETLAHAETERLGRHYLAATGRFRTTRRPCFTDKMPANWRFVALIHRILPGARIIDVRRDPLACCFSAYTTYFNRHTDFPNTLEDLGEYHRHYIRMTEAMEASLPGRLHRLDYERLVSDSEREIRALLDFLGLPFSPSCLDPQANSRAIYTPSASQVRAPIRAMGDKWLNYEAWLQPLRNALAR